MCSSSVSVFKSWWIVAGSWHAASLSMYVVADLEQVGAPFVSTSLIAISYSFIYFVLRVCSLCLVVARVLVPGIWDFVLS